MRWVEVGWAPRVHLPVRWQTQIESGGPRKLMHVSQHGHTREAAVMGIVSMLQSAGYTEVARARHL